MSYGNPWDERDLPHLRAHLQLALELELWTIPYYAAALTSIANPNHAAARGLRAIVRQELAHAVALANVANSFGAAPELGAPRYGGPTLPHLRFDLHVPNPTSLFAPHSTALGPLDHPRLNAMCLIEYPIWPPGDGRRHDDLADYTSVRDFYDSIVAGVEALRRRIRPDRGQIADGRFASLAIREATGDPYTQVRALLELVREQGEGAAIGDGVPGQVDADDPQPDASHFAKLNALRDEPLPELRPGEREREPAPGSPGAAAQAEFAASVERAFEAWGRRFAGKGSGDLDAWLEQIIEAADWCWRSHASPRMPA